MLRILLAAALVVVLAASARGDTINIPAPADAVALLPLDADAKLEIYGQPVASEIARALVAGGVDVVVVGPKMAVPERAKLIVDGTISAAKGDVVTLTARVRNPVDGTTVGTTLATAQGLVNIDRAAAELSAKILPMVRTQLEAMRKPANAVKPDVHVAVVQPDPVRPLALAVTASGSAEPLRVALAEAAGPWAKRANREIKAMTAQQLARKADGADLGITLEIKRYSVAQAKIPYARARVRVKIVDTQGVLFDRVVVTDSVLGDKGIAPDALAARTAREVLDILRPHLRRLAGW